MPKILTSLPHSSTVLESLQIYNLRLISKQMNLQEYFKKSLILMGYPDIKKLIQRYSQ